MALLLIFAFPAYAGCFLLKALSLLNRRAFPAYAGCFLDFDLSRRGRLAFPAYAGCFFETAAYVARYVLSRVCGMFPVFF